jgi:isopentenyldiphosphate isomerase
MQVEEILDVLDHTGKIIGQCSRKEIHVKNHFYFVVDVFIVNQAGQVLLQQRSLNNSYYPGYWDTAVGGHVNQGEPLELAAYRELAEEAGISMESGLIELGESTPEMKSNTSFGKVYLLQHEGPFEFDKSDLNDLRWFNPEEIDQKLSSNELTPGIIGLWKHYKDILKKK